MNPRILELITDYKENFNEEALVTLWECFQPLVINTMRKFFVSITDQDDIRQEAFLQLLESANRYDLGQNVPFESFYKMNLTYWFLNQIRKKKELLVVDNEWQGGFSMTDVIESSIGNAEEAAEYNEITAALNDAFNLLTDKQRQVVVLFYLKGKRLGDIAELMGCSYKVAFKHKDAGIKKIRKQMYPSPDFS